MSGVNLKFAHDTEVALASVAALVNTDLDGVEHLPDPAALDAFLDRESFSGARAGTVAELEEVRGLRRRLRQVWDAASPWPTAARAAAKARPISRSGPTALP
jgi:hypothetical protein